MGWAERLNIQERFRHKQEHKEFLLRCAKWASCPYFRKGDCSDQGAACWKNEEMLVEERILDKAW